MNGVVSFLLIFCRHSHEGERSAQLSICFYTVKFGQIHCVSKSHIFQLTLIIENQPDTTPAWDANKSLQNSCMLAVLALSTTSKLCCFVQMLLKCWFWKIFRMIHLGVFGLIYELMLVRVLRGSPRHLLLLYCILSPIVSSQSALPGSIVLALEFSFSCRQFALLDSSSRT